MSLSDAATTVRLQSCRACSRRWQTPLPSCPYCGTAEPGDDDVDAIGAVYSWVEVAKVLGPGPADVPYTVLLVELEAGARVFGRYAPGGAPVAGARVLARCTTSTGALLFSPT